MTLSDRGPGRTAKPLFNQVDPGHGSASRPSMSKIVESKVRNRTLVCFRSDAQPGKTNSPFTCLKASSQDRTSPLGERDFASAFEPTPTIIERQERFIIPSIIFSSEAGSEKKRAVYITDLTVRQS